MSIRNTLKIGDIPLPLEIGRGLYYYTSASLAKAKAEWFFARPGLQKAEDEEYELDLQSVLEENREIERHNASTRGQKWEIYPLPPKPSRVRMPKTFTRGAIAEKLKTVSDMVRRKVEPKDLQRDNAGFGKAKSKVLFDWLRALGVYPYRGEITEEDVFRLLEGKIATAHKVVELARDDGLDPVSVAHVEKLFERLLESGRMASFAAPFGVDLANIYVDFIG